MGKDLLTRTKLSLALDVHLPYLIQILCCVCKPYEDLYVSLKNKWDVQFRKQPLEQYTCNYTTFPTFFPLVQEIGFFLNDEVTFPNASFTPDFVFGFKICRSRLHEDDSLNISVMLVLSRHSTNEYSSSFCPPVLRLSLKLKEKTEKRKHKADGSR